MSYIKAHDLAYSIEKVIERRMRSLKLPRPKAIAEDLTPDIMREIPSEAFEPKGVWESGALFFHSAVEEEKIIDLQFEILATHQNIKAALPITLYLSSFGGSVFAGLALCSTIQEVRRASRVVNVHIMGAAMSMGSLIAQVCDYRSIEPQAWLMIHEMNHTLPDEMKTSILRDEADFADKLELQTFAIYAARTGKPVEYWRRKMHRRDWFLTAQEALEEGLLDEIKSVPAYPRYRKRRPESQSPNA